MFEVLKKKFINISKLDYSQIMFDVWSNEEVQEIIIELNTKDQLFDKGIDSNSNSLGEYSPFTVSVKQAQGLPFDRITLFDTGDFYGSFDIKPNRDGFEITANPIKEDSNLFKDYGEKILGLTAESKEKLSKLIINTIIEEVRYEIARD